MKDFLARAADYLALDHVIITLIGVASAILSSAKNDVGVPILVRGLNVISGSLLASLAGYALLEAGWLPWLSSGCAYLVGHVGNRLVNALLVAAKMAEVDPLSFAGKVIGLIWEWKVPIAKK